MICAKIYYIECRRLVGGSYKRIKSESTNDVMIR